MGLRTVTLSLIEISIGFLPFIGWGIFWQQLFVHILPDSNRPTEGEERATILLWSLLTVMIFALLDTLVLTYWAQGAWWWVRWAVASLGFVWLISFSLRHSSKRTIRSAWQTLGILMLVFLLVLGFYSPFTKQWVKVEPNQITSYHLIDDVVRHILYIQEKSRADYWEAMIAPNAYPEKVGSYYYGMHSVMSLLTWYTRSFQPNDFLAAFLLFLALNLTVAVIWLWQWTRSRFFIVTFLIFIFLWDSVTDPANYSLYAWFLVNPSSFAHFSVITGLVLAFFAPKISKKILCSLTLISVFAQSTKAPSFLLNYLPLAIATWRWLDEKIPSWYSLFNWQKLAANLKKMLPLLVANGAFVIALAAQKLIAWRDPLHRTVIFRPRDFINENLERWDNWTVASWFFPPWHSLEKIISKSFFGINLHIWSFVLLGLVLAGSSLLIIIIFHLCIKHGFSLPATPSIWSPSRYWPIILISYFFVLLGYFAPMLFAVKETTDPQWQGQLPSWDGMFNSMQQSLHLFGSILLLAIFLILTSFERLIVRPLLSKILATVFLLFISIFTWSVSSDKLFPISGILIQVSPQFITPIRTISQENFRKFWPYKDKECPERLNFYLEHNGYLQALFACRANKGAYWYYR